METEAGSILCGKAYVCVYVSCVGVFCVCVCVCLIVFCAGVPVCVCSSVFMCVCNSVI